MTEALTTQALADALATLPDWSVEDGVLTRTRTLDTFLDALDWVQTVGGVAEQMNHHPDIEIRWRTVTLRVCTHDAQDQLTSLDIAFASTVDQIDR